MNYKNGHYYSLNEYLQNSFGFKVYKLALDGGFTCPNRDGTLDTRGCIFCSEGGSGEFAEGLKHSIKEQLDQAKVRVADKIKSGKYIAYFQSFTNTYAPVERLEKVFMEAICDESIVALSIGTRPDCIPDGVLNLLDKLNKIKPVWVELGLQTIHERTVEYIRRGYPLAVFDTAVKRLKSKGIVVVVHLILGLPLETSEMILQSVDYVAHSGADGIKLQLLHILKGTDLEKEYADNKFSVMEQDEYINLLCECIERLPPNMVIHRLTGDGAKRLLVAPMWSANKKVVLNSINNALNVNKIVQGSKFTE